MQFLNNIDDAKTRELNERIRAESIARADFYSNMSDEDYAKIEDEAYNDLSDDLSDNLSDETRCSSNYDKLLEARKRQEQLDFEDKKAAALKQLENISL